MHEATSDELARWDELVMANPDGGQSLQTKAWGEFKGRHGWQPCYFVFDEAKTAALFLTKKATGFGQIWYSPKGPGVGTAAELDMVVEALQGNGIQGVVAKLEPELTDLPQQIWLVRAPFDIHISQATIVIDLKPDIEELLAGFKQKTRYNIRLSERHGVKVEAVEANAKHCEELLELMMDTQARTGYAARTAEYYFDYWQSQAAAGQGQIFLAMHEGKPLAGAFVQLLGSKAWYKDGGSSRDENSVQAPYGLQWGIMQWLKEHKITSYDLVGVPRENDPTSSLVGLVQFKSGFNGERREFIGTYDLPLSSWKYWQWRRVGERATLQYSRRVKHELWY